MRNNQVKKILISVVVLALVFLASMFVLKLGDEASISDITYDYFDSEEFDSVDNTDNDVATDLPTLEELTSLPPTSIASLYRQLNDNIDTASDVPEDLQSRHIHFDIYDVKDAFDDALEALPDGSVRREPLWNMIQNLISRVKKNRRYHRWHENPILLHWAYDYSQELNEISAIRAVTVVMLQEALLFEDRELTRMAMDVLRPAINNGSLIATMYGLRIERYNIRWKPAVHEIASKTFFDSNKHLLISERQKYGEYADYVNFHFWLRGMGDEQEKLFRWSFEQDRDEAKRRFDDLTMFNHWLGKLALLKYCDEKYEWLQCPSSGEEAVKLWQEIADEVPWPEAEYIIAGNYLDGRNGLEQSRVKGIRAMKRAWLYGSWGAHKKLQLFSDEISSFKDFGVELFVVGIDERSDRCSDKLPLSDIASWHDLENLDRNNRQIPWELVARDAGFIYPSAAVSYRNKVHMRNGNLAYGVEFRNLGEIFPKNRVVNYLEGPGLALYEALDIRPAMAHQLCINSGVERRIIHP